MKNAILNFKQYVRFLASIITSREFAVIYVLAGTLAQVAHTYYLTESISSLTGVWRTTQAVILSIFISSSLLYFTAIADDADTKESKRVHFAVTMFTIIEILINIYYYSRYLLIGQEEPRIFDYIFAILISCLIPVTIKLYSSHIRAKEWVMDIEQDKKAFVGSVDNSEIYKSDSKHESFENAVDLSNEQVADIIVKDAEIVTIEDDVDNSDEAQQEQKQEMSENDIENYIKSEIAKFELEMHEKLTADNKAAFEIWVANKTDEIQADIEKSFKKNSDLFLQQFENRIKLLTTAQIDRLK